MNKYSKVGGHQTPKATIKVTSPTSHSDAEPAPNGQANAPHTAAAAPAKK